MAVTIDEQYQKEIQLDMMQKFNKNLELLEADGDGKVKAEVNQAFDKLNQLMLETYEKQLKGLKNKIAYISISFLWSYTLLGDYQLRVDLLDSLFWLDERECSTQLEFTSFLKFMDDDIEYILKQYISKGMVIYDYEKERLKREYIPIYKTLMENKFKGWVPKILGLSGFDQMQKEDDIKITFGEYLDKTIPIY